MNSRQLLKLPLQICVPKRLGHWSSLAVAFNTKPNLKHHIDLKNGKGLFDVPELTTHEGFYVLKDQCMARTDALIEEATSPIRSRKMVEIFDELSDTLCKVADLAEFIRVAHPSVKYMQAAEMACLTASSIVEKLNTHRNLYKALKKVVDEGDIIQMNDVDRHVSSLFLFDFEQCGIHLSEEERRRVVSLNDNILHLGQQFVSGTAKPRLINKMVLPEELRHMLPNVNNNIVISGLFSDSSNALVREVAYKIFLHPEEHQDYLLTSLLQARNELAQVCGFDTYAKRALRDSTMETPVAVTAFLDALNDKLKDRADDDFKVMSEMKRLEGSPGDLAVWDVPYFSYTAKKNFFKYNNSDFSPYFSLGACMEGLNTLYSRLYSITLVNEEMSQGETWHPQVYKLAVVHETEGILGHIYCDFYERDGKPKQDCHFTIRGGKILSNGTYQNPVVVIMLNLTSPRWSRPALLSPGMVDNLFHEMGHAMHSMLGRTAYQHITGTRCSTDFAEVPSVLMEYFASDPRVLRSFAKHFQTNEPMPEDMLECLCASKRLFSGSEAQVQLFYSALDQNYHGMHPLKGTTTEVLADTQHKYYSLPYVENTCWQLRFSHLVGYGAKYYSYLVSRALASWIWQTYFADDPFSRQQGELYRRECLAHGGGKPPRKLITEFLKRQPAPEHLTEALIKEIYASQESTASYVKNGLKK